jgi:hypothetical protein
MSRAQFVRNTLSAVQMQVHPERYASTPDLTSDDSSSLRAPAARSPKRSGSIASWNSVGALDDPAAPVPPAQGSQPQSPARSPSINPAAYDKGWELDMEVMLKVGVLHAEPGPPLTHARRTSTTRSSRSRSCSRSGASRSGARRRRRSSAARRTTSSRTTASRRSSAGASAASPACSARRPAARTRTAATGA